MLPAGMLLAACLLLARCTDVAGPDADRRPVVRELSAQEQQVVASDNRFGLQLFQHLSEEEPGNVFISPLSVSMALGMTLNGAHGETRAAMEATLQKAGLSQEEINASYQSLIELLTALDPKVLFQIANSVWYREGFEVESTFVDVNKAYFDAEVQALDFSSAEALKTINGWVDEKTHGRIEEIIDRIGSEVVMYLINAIYFKGTWMQQFDKELTQEDTFTLEDGSQRTVDMMTLEEPAFALYADEDLQAVDLPYGDSLYSMLILLPQGGKGVDALVSELDQAYLDRITRGLRSTRLSELRMPRFKLEYKIELKDVLTALGMSIAFDPQQADFTGINKQGGLYISRVLHKTFVEVNEEGTEAAAATAVEVGIVSLPPSLRIDRPFVFAIRERHSGTVLFIGKMMDPA